MRNVCKRPVGLFVLSGVAVIVLIACFSGCSTTHPKGQAPEARGIEEVSHVRRLLRAACGRLKAVNAGAADRTALMADARDLTAHAVQDWGCFVHYWGSSAPPGYSTHPDWNASTSELTAGMAEMLRRIDEDDPLNAFRVCGSACAKFVALNEQAGVRRTSDVLFHFRKAAKPLAEPLAKGDVDAVSAKVAQLREIRDKALTDPVGGTGTAAQKTRALEAFSSAVDAFASAVKAAEGKQLSSTYGKMMAAMETAYDLFL